MASLNIDGILVAMSEGRYVPIVQVEDFATGQKTICEYGSALARESGLSNPKHWAHAVYRTLQRLCDEHQQELQGGSMEDHEETRLDREEADRARRHGYGA